MKMDELESKIDQDFVAIRYNVELEGPAITPENDPDVQAILPKDEPFRAIAMGVLHGDLDETLNSVKNGLHGDISPMDVINNGLMKGMDAVNALYTKGFYFLPDLMLSGDAMMEGLKESEKSLGHRSETKGTVVSFVAEGDPHDIGKNLVVMFLRAGGYNAVDLGRDVPVEEVIDAVKEHQPIFMTGTALMTTTMTAFPRVVEEMQKNGLEVPAIGCGGGSVRRDFVESFPMSVYGVEAYHTPRIADSIVKDGKSWKDIRKEYSKIVGEFVPEYD
ncbi:MAG: methanol--corrinoid protein MtaC [Methanobacterium sp.]